MIIKKTKLRLIFPVIMFFGIFGWAESSMAATINAASCSQADVQAAVNSAVDGDTILVPAENCTWSSAANIGKPLNIMGAGSSEGGTKLIASGSMNSGFFNITGFTSTELTRISGFYFEMTDWTPASAIYVHSVNADNIRIDHNTFNQGNKPILFLNPKGLIDNNYFYNPNIAIEYSAGSRAKADASWASMAAGTADSLFIEDNYFIDDANFSQTYSNERIGTYNGGKLVVRYNHFDSKNISASYGDRTIDPIMTHGSDFGYWQRGTEVRRGQSVLEVYNNSMEGKRIDYAVIVRGSANLIHDNIIGKTKYTPILYLREEEYDVGDDWGPVRTAWPAEDQVHNTFIWNNIYDGQAINFGLRLCPLNSECTGSSAPYGCCTGSKIGTCNETIVKNQDYFLHAPCGASENTDAYGNVCTHGKETFTGANGASNSYPTDGITYTTLGTMIFTATGDNAYYPYTPYTYPHPLRTTADTTPPAPPSGLVVH